jgi:eukaryotic-like serine/threonine-protein kinase
VENTRKAYQLRDQVSEPEKFLIESNYYSFVTADLEKARQSFELWALTYPRDVVPSIGLSYIHENFGEFDKAVAADREALRLDPGKAVCYSNLVGDYMNSNRLGEARATIDEAQAKKLDSPSLHTVLYQLAFLQGDAAGMAQQVAWSAGKPGVEDVLLANEASTAAYTGQLGKAREFSRRAVVSSERAEEKETAAGYEADAALREALFGDPAEAKRRTAAALGLSTGPDVQYRAALALAVVGDTVKAHALMDELAKRFPEGTIVQFKYLPAVRAQLALSRNNAAKAIEALQAATPFELGSSVVPLFPVYVRGEAYLAAHQDTSTACARRLRKDSSWTC